MAVAIGIDFGTKRIGIAITDDAGIIASPLTTVTQQEVIPTLEKLLQTKSISTIVVGDPKRLNGEETHATELANQFCIHLKRKFPNCEIVRIDERFTSTMAAQSLIESGHSKKTRKDKTVLDQVSAALILQSWLNQKK